MVHYPPSNRGMKRTIELLPKHGEKQPLLKKFKGIGVRHFQVLLLFGDIVFEYMVRQCFSIAIVQMALSENNAMVMDSTEKALMLSAFFFGNGLLQIPLGAIGRKGVASIVVAFCLALSGILTLALPLGASIYGVTGICVLRFLTGLAQGAMSPNIINLMATWILPKEKDCFCSLVYSGIAFGDLLTSILSGYIGYHYDWPAICYFNGAVVLPWALLRLIAGSQDAKTCSYISQEERKFILQSFEDDKSEKNKVAPQRVPWRKIMTSGPVLALLVVTWCTHWCTWTVITLTPSYISSVLGFNLQTNGFLSSLPFLASCICGIFVAFFSPTLKRITGLDDNILQPMWNSLGQYGTCLCILLLAYLPLDAMGAVTLLVVAAGVSSFAIAGYLVSVLKIAPNFSGIIAGINATFANTASIAGPLLSTYFLTDTTDLYLWRVVFLVAATLTFIGNTVFVIWGSSKPQPWNELEERREHF